MNTLDKAAKVKPDIILLDIKMPEIDGFETCRRLKADSLTHSIPVIFISVLTDITDKVNAFKNGGVDYITKPFQEEEVISRIENHLRIYHLQRSLEEKNIHLEKTQKELNILNELLTKYNDKLEDMVKDRTKKLDDTNTQLSASLKEKDILIKEVHHRVRNNLQIISSMLHLGFANITDPESIDVFRSSYSRVKVLAIIHEKLCESKDFSSVNIVDFIDTLFTELISAYEYKYKPTLTVNTNRDSLGINLMIICGLILNELISNSLRYALTKDKQGDIIITFNKGDDGQYVLILSDNGMGFLEVKLDASRYSGLQIVKDLVYNKLKGDMKIKNNNGTTVTITFRKPIEETTM